MRAALVMERFALECAHIVSDFEFFQDSGYRGRVHLLLPSLQQFDQDTDWQTLPTELVSQVLQIPLELRNASAGVAFYADHAGEDEAFEECADQAALCGAMAVNLAHALRRFSRLPRRALAGVEWDFEETLQRRAVQVLARREKKKLRYRTDEGVRPESATRE